MAKSLEGEFLERKDADRAIRRVITIVHSSHDTGISLRAAQIAFGNAAAGQLWHGNALPVVETAGHRGGRCGARLAFRLDLGSDELRAKLGLPATLLETPVQTGVNARPRDGQIAVARDKLRIIDPILKTPAGSSERAQGQGAFPDRRRGAEAPLPGLEPL